MHSNSQNFCQLLNEEHYMHYISELVFSIVNSSIKPYKTYRHGFNGFNNHKTPNTIYIWIYGTPILA